MKYLVILVVLSGCASSGKHYTDNTLYDKRPHPVTGRIVQWECRKPTYAGKDCKPQTDWGKPSIWMAK